MSQFPTKHAAALLCLASFVGFAVIVGGSAVRYARGTQRLPASGFGYPSEEALNLDPHFRAFPLGVSCDGSLAAEFRNAIERATFKALFALFGPMSGSYGGPYPTETEARAILKRRGMRAEIDRLTRGLRIQGVVVRIPQQALARARIPGSVQSVEVALVERACLLVAVQVGAVHRISLFDVDGARWFAAYRYEDPP